MKNFTFSTITLFAITLSLRLTAQSWTDKHTVAPYDLTTDGTNVYKVKYGGNGIYASADEAGT